mmetsp:Transcript_28040/g.99704  ORF Transcript_28040/g.99704 Transcript_28040/m.99704 type:complete len:327 (+) Transcript_28040:722-1702(+)
MYLCPQRTPQTAAPQTRVDGYPMCSPRGRVVIMLDGKVLVVVQVVATRFGFRRRDELVVPRLHELGGSGLDGCRRRLFLLRRVAGPLARPFRHDARLGVDFARGDHAPLVLERHVDVKVLRDDVRDEGAGQRVVVDHERSVSPFRVGLERGLAEHGEVRRAVGFARRPLRVLLRHAKDRRSLLARSHVLAHARRAPAVAVLEVGHHDLDRLAVDEDEGRGRERFREDGHGGDGDRLEFEVEVRVERRRAHERDELAQQVELSLLGAASAVVQHDGRRRRLGVDQVRRHRCQHVGHQSRADARLVEDECRRHERRDAALRQVGDEVV